MSQIVSFKIKNRASVTLVAVKQESFLNENFQFIGFRLSPDKPLADSMIDITQGSNFVVQTKLINGDASAFDLTGFSSITLGIYQRTPLLQNISLTAGSISGIPSDGLVNFVLSSTDTNFIGYAEAQVQLVTGSGTFAFDPVQVVYRRNLFLG